jgi:diguanylate cyclase (GGDEF)-like protein
MAMAGETPDGNGDHRAPIDGEGAFEHLSDVDQTLADGEQTLSDRDQTLSDRDQQASDEDQAASDWDRDHGGDSASHDHTSAMRAGTARARVEIANLRDETAEQRDKAAHDRDRVAARRDRAAALADEEALALDGRDGLYDRHTLRVQELRGRAAAARTRAEDDRKRAAHDRESAARDREQAARDREQAARDRQQAGIDELTGARRRGVGLQELQREMDRARRTGESLVAAFVDVDYLKAVNDEHGHGAGDELLRDVVAALRRHMRCYDLVVRVGGDEFVCALPAVSRGEARGRFDDVRAELDDGPAASSISFGLSELRDGESPTGLIDRADRDLRATRNR